jgi:hypothetical protein
MLAEVTTWPEAAVKIAMWAALAIIMWAVFHD